ncbi:hypothetical protein [Amycolatopsis sp. NPDC051102]|uniref:hypothetical protein n=1 Tax=Amycolatopsis sp. NPDC051102 TaxID=3155163 RepID=UPI00342AAF54
MSTEQPPDRTFVENTEFQCRYEGKYVHPWLLDLWIIAATGSYRPAKSLENYKKEGQNRLAIAYVVKHRSDVYARLATTLAARL